MSHQPRLDHLPRLRVSVGGRLVPTFRAVGVAGLYLAIVVTLATALVSGLSVVVAIGLIVAGVGSFFAWALLRRAVTGRERLVALEHTWAALLAGAGFLSVSHAAGTNREVGIDRSSYIALGLDVMSVALAVFLSVGRLGCLAVGCCHGAPAERGIRYPTEHGLPAHLTERPLVPVQLLESTALALIGLVGALLLGGPPGRSIVWFLTSMAVMRFGTDGLRGDERPALGDLTVARLMCGIQLIAGAVLAVVWLDDGATTGGTVLAAIVGLIGLTAAMVIVGRRRSDALTDSAHVAEVWGLLVDLARRADANLRSNVADQVESDRSSLGVVLVVSAHEDGHLVSMRHPEAPVEQLARSFSIGPAQRHGGLSWFRLEEGDPRLGVRPVGRDEMDDETGAAVRHDVIDATHTNGDRASAYFEPSSNDAVGTP